MRPVPQLALDFIGEREGEVLHVYDDRDPERRELKPGDYIEGTATAGRGHTGPDVVVGMTVTKALSDAWFKGDVDIAARRLEAKVPDDVIADLTKEQYAAVLDFIFNLTTGDPSKPEWTIWKRLRARDYDRVPLEMMKFVNQTIREKTVIDGKAVIVEKKVKVQGLVNRRAMDVMLWATKEPGSVDADPPSSLTRSSPTPPTAADPVPLSKSKALIAGAVGAAAGAGPMVNQVTQAIQPYAAQSHYVQQMLGILATIGAACAGAAIFFIWLQKRNAQN